MKQVSTAKLIGSGREPQLPQTVLCKRTTLGAPSKSMTP